VASTTDANQFFYLEPVGRTVKGVADLRRQNPMAPVRVKNGAGWDGEIEAAWLRPVIQSPREIQAPRVRLRATLGGGEPGRGPGGPHGTPAAPSGA